MFIACNSCKKEKPEKDFGFYAGKRKRKCESCCQYAKDYAKRNRDHLLEMRRFRYHTDPDRKVAKKNSEYMRKIRENPERRRSLRGNHVMRKYGITIEQYEGMITKQ